MEEIYRSQFRLPYPLYERLKASADKNRRSVNAELVARLEESLQSQGMEPDQSGKNTPDGRQLSLTQYPHAIDRSVVTSDSASQVEQSFMASLLELINEYRPPERIDLPPDNAKPKPNTGPEPRKRFPKK